MAITNKSPEKIKEITAKEYAALKGCTEQNITKHIRNNKLEYLPFVLKIKRFSRFVVLEVPHDLSKTDFNFLNYQIGNINPKRWRDYLKNRVYNNFQDQAK